MASAYFDFSFAQHVDFVHCWLYCYIDGCFSSIIVCYYLYYYYCTLSCGYWIGELHLIKPTFRSVRSLHFAHRTLLFRRLLLIKQKRGEKTNKAKKSEQRLLQHKWTLNGMTQNLIIFFFTFLKLFQKNYI